VPNKRSADQIVLTFAVTKSLAGEIDVGRSKLRGMTRSQFVRDAIAEKLRSMGLVVPDDVVVPPDRTSPVLSPRDAAEVRNVSEQIVVSSGLALNESADVAAPPSGSPAQTAPNRRPARAVYPLSLIHISEPTRPCH
jgi:hypothetical protein